MYAGDRLVSRVLDPWTYLNVLFRSNPPPRQAERPSVSIFKKKKEANAGKLIVRNDLRWESNLSFFEPNE